MKLKELADLLEGTLFGDGGFEIRGVGTQTKYREGDVIFIKKPKGDLSFPKTVALVVDREVNFPNYIKVKDVRLSLAKTLEAMYPEQHPEGISDRAVIGVNVRIGEGVYIAPFTYVGKGVILERGVKVYPFTYIGDNSYIGEDTIIFSGVNIYPNTVIGRRVRIHSGAVVGSDGFGYYIGKDFIKKLNHIGKVIIEDGVEIGANVCIDRALIEETIIGKESKIDNLVQIAHNCKLGERNIIAGQTGFAGSVETGKGVVMGGQVGIADHIKIGDGVIISAKSGVTSDLEGGKTYSSTISAEEIHKWRRIQAVIKRLPELWKFFLRMIK